MGLLGVSEGLDTHGLAGGQQDDGGVTRLDELGVVLGRLTGTAVNLLLDLSKLASNVSGVAIKDGAVAVGDLSGMVEDNDLGGEVRNAGGGLVLGVRGNVSSLDVLDRDVLDVEANVVSGHGLGERLVVHLDGLDLSGQLAGGEGNNHTGLDDTGFDSADGYCSNTSDFVDILEGKSEGLVGGPSGRNDGVECVQKGGSGGLALLPLNVPSLVPSHVLGLSQHVVSVPSRDGDEGNSGWVITDLLDKARYLLLNFLKPSLAVRRFSGVHLVNSYNQLFDTKGISEQSVLS